MANRNAGIDHLRFFLILLVIFHHVAIAYGGSGGWYWREEADASNLWLVAFNAINQSFFMGCFFLLAGYYTAASYARKGGAAFIADRGKRLGVPWLGYFFVLSPLTIALAQTGFSREIWPLMSERLVSFDLEPGPLWFVQALLLFSIAYMGLQRLGVGVFPATRCLPRFPVLAAIALLLGLSSFLVRLWIPVGETVLWLQLGYFPCYVFFFGAGCAAAQERVLESITGRQVLPWLAVALSGIATLPFALHGAFGTGSFDGGWNANAFYYAMWDPLVGFGITIALLWAVHRWLNDATAATAFLTRRAYAMFVIHPPVVVATSLGFADIALAAGLKFLAVGAVASLVCIALASVLLLLPGVKNVL